MYGLTNRFIAHPGKRDAVIAAMLGDGDEPTPGCISFVVAHDPADPDAVCITEVWKDQASHAASFNLPAVAASIRIAVPFIADFGTQIITTPIGGIGLPESTA
ncbi:MAG: putative quinol monooxygenase [Paracoccaceae bacterium]